MNSIVDLIIDKNKASIISIVEAYKVFAVPAFIRIETGTYGRNIITPVLNIDVPKDLYEQWFNSLNPVLMIKRLREKNELYLESYGKLTPGQALVAIDYESENIRNLFHPIVWGVGKRG